MKTGFFSESENVKSMTRLKTFLALAVALTVAGYSVVTQSVEANIWLIGVLLGYSGGEKVIQKFAEKK